MAEASFEKDEEKGAMKKKKVVVVVRLRRIFGVVDSRKLFFGVHKKFKKCAIVVVVAIATRNFA
jgi:hypothetical protein